MSNESPGLVHAELRQLFALWADRCRDGGVPQSSDLEPEELRPWMFNIVIMDIAEDGRFAYSFYGRTLSEAFGESRLGQTLERLPAEQQAILHAEYDRVRSERRPVFRLYTADFDGVVQTWERLVLPLSSDGEIIDKLLVAAYEV